MTSISSLARLGSRYLDYRFSGRSRTTVRIVERPGRWMSEEELALLVADVRAVVRSAVPAGELEYGVVTGGRGVLASSILTLVYAEGRPVGFNALAVLDCELRGDPVEVLHLGLGMVDPGYRGRGLSELLYSLTCFLLFARRRMRPLWISNVTQVPAVVGLVGIAYANVFPTPDPRSRRSFDHLCLSRQIMKCHRSVFGVGPEAEFDESTFVIANSYTGGSDNLKKTFAETAKHRVASFNQMCEGALDYDRGDDFLQLGQWNIASARRHFMRVKSTISPTSIGLLFTLLLLESLVVPLLHWFDADHALGELRPWGEGT